MTNQIETSGEEDLFIMSEDEARQLWELLEHEYISHEFFPLVHIMLKRLLVFYNEH